MDGTDELRVEARAHPTPLDLIPGYGGDDRGSSSVYLQRASGRMATMPSLGTWPITIRWTSRGRCTLGRGESMLDRDAPPAYAQSSIASPDTSTTTSSSAGREWNAHRLSWWGVTGAAPQAQACSTVSSADTFVAVSTVDDRTSARENLRFVGEIFSVDAVEADRQAARRLGEPGLAQRTDDRVGGVSSGMRKRPALARVLLHDPPLLRGEPTSALDLMVSGDVRRTSTPLGEAGR